MFDSAFWAHPVKVKGNPLFKGGMGCPGNELGCLESWFAVRSDWNRHKFATISNRAIRTAAPKTVQIVVEALLFFTLKIGFKLRDSIR